MMDNERNDRDFAEVRKDCPWFYKDKCRPVEMRIRIMGVAVTLKDCVQENCTLFHFKKFFGGRKV